MVVLVISAPLSGCLWEEEVPPEAIEEPTHFGAFSVVAPIDTGINVYHDHFAMNDSYPIWLLDGMGVNMVCDIAKNGTWQERYDADRESCWDVIEAGDIV